MNEKNQTKIRCAIRISGFVWIVLCSIENRISFYSFCHQNVDFIPSVAWMITSSRNQQRTGNECKRKKKRRCLNNEHTQLMYAQKKTSENEVMHVFGMNSMKKRRKWMERRCATMNRVAHFILFALACFSLFLVRFFSESIRGCTIRMCVL